MAFLGALAQRETLSDFFLVKFSPGPTDNTTQEAAVAASDSSPLRTMFLGADSAPCPQEHGKPPCYVPIVGVRHCRKVPQMPLPPELLEEPEETAVIGDLDAFMQYIDSGQAEQDWHERIAIRLRELEELF